MFHGITATAPGFYGPQGRELRLHAAYPGLNDRISSFRYRGERVINFEMETSALYSLGKMMGHNTLTICAVIANRMKGTYSPKPKETIKKLTQVLLDRFTAD